jgi:hypothetical protein
VTGLLVVVLVLGALVRFVALSVTVASLIVGVVLVLVVAADVVQSRPDVE